jgi:hypothetical protein
VRRSWRHSGRRASSFRSRRKRAVRPAKHEKTSQRKIGRRPRPSGRQRPPPHRPARRVFVARQQRLKRWNPAFMRLEVPPPPERAAHLTHSGSAA